MSEWFDVGVRLVKDHAVASVAAYRKQRRPQSVWLLWVEHTVLGVFREHAVACDHGALLHPTVRWRVEERHLG